MIRDTAGTEAETLHLKVVAQLIFLTLVLNQYNINR